MLPFCTCCALCLWAISCLVFGISWASIAGKAPKKVTGQLYIDWKSQFGLIIAFTFLGMAAVTVCTCMGLVGAKSKRFAIAFFITLGVSFGTQLGFIIAINANSNTDNKKKPIREWGVEEEVQELALAQGIMYPFMVCALICIAITIVKRNRIDLPCLNNL